MLVTACSGKSSDSSPEDPPPASTTQPRPTPGATSIAVTSSGSELRYAFPDESSPEDRALIREATELALPYFAAQLTLTTPPKIDFRVFSDPTDPRFGIRSTRGEVRINVSHPEWSTKNAVDKKVAVAAEIAQQFQFFNARNTSIGAYFLNGGAAKLLGYHAIAASGLVAVNAVITQQVATIKGQKAPLITSIDADSDHAVAYGILAMNLLFTNKGFAAYGAYINQIPHAVWEQSFEQAFGETPAAFDGRFSQYLATLS